MFKKVRNILFMILILSSVYSSAQERVIAETDSIKNDKEVFIGAGIQYISNLTYAGRGDINSVPIALPTLTLVSKSGFFLGSAGYLNLSNQGGYSADGFSLSPGYVFSINKNKELGATISGTQYFFKDSSQIILSSFNTTADFQLYYQPKWFRVALSSSYQIGKQTNDVINSLDISKNINLSKNKSLFVNPLLSFMSGTQSFTETYFEQGSRQRRIITNPSSGGGGLGGILPGGGNNQTPQESFVNEPFTEEKKREIKQYKPLSFTLSFPVTYKKGSFQANFAPFFIKPINTVSPEAESQNAGNIFLFSTGLSYTF